MKKEYLWQECYMEQTNLLGSLNCVLRCARNCLSIDDRFWPALWEGTTVSCVAQCSLGIGCISVLVGCAVDLLKSLLLWFWDLVEFNLIDRVIQLKVWRKCANFLEVHVWMVMSDPDNTGPQVLSWYSVLFQWYNFKNQNKLNFQKILISWNEIILIF